METTRAAGECFLHFSSTLLRLLHLLYDIEVMWRKSIKHALSMFYTLINMGFSPIRVPTGSYLYYKAFWSLSGSFPLRTHSLELTIFQQMSFNLSKKLHASDVTLSKSSILLKGSELQTTNAMGQRSHYIDPGNYLDLMELISTFTNELDRRDTKLEGIIGQGRYYSLIQ